MKKTSCGIFFAAGLAALLFAGCTSENELLKERSAQAVRHHEKSQYKTPPDRTLTLRDCIQLALANTLDRKVGEFYLTIASQEGAENVMQDLPGIQHRYGMDPEKIPPALRQMMIPSTMDRVLLLMDWSFTYLKNSKEYSNPKWSLEQASFRMLKKLYQAMMTEALKAENAHTFGREGECFSSLDLDLALGFMDFGLACFNYRQNRNREWIRKQASIRMAQSLAFDVTKAYVEFLTAQRSVDMIESFLKNSNPAVWKRIRDARGVAPYKAFGLLRERNELERQYLLYAGARENALYRLNTLMGYHPAAKIKLDSPVLDDVPEIGDLSRYIKRDPKSPAPLSLKLTDAARKQFLLPKLDVLEKIALLNRPELARNDGKEGVSSIDCAKVILTLIPQLRLFFHYNGHCEDFRYDRSWWDLGYAASINLLNLPARGAEFHARYKAWKADEVAVYGSSIAVLSQVRLSHNALMKNAALLKAIDEENNFYNISYKRNKGSGKNVNEIENASFQIRNLKVRLQRLQSVKEFYLSAGRLIRSLGLNDLEVYNLAACQELLEKAQEAAEKNAGM